MMQQKREPKAAASSRRGLIRLGLIVAICFFFASMMPAGLIMASFSSLAMLGALATAVFAALLREPVWADHLTRWDQASLLLALGLLAGWTVDPHAAAEALAQLETTRAAAAS
jgi:hypothetical protein